MIVTILAEEERGYDGDALRRPVPVDGERADVFVTRAIGDISRSQLKNRMISLMINGQQGKLSNIITPGDRVEAVLQDPLGLSAEPEELKMHILYEDENVIVIDKERGVVVHPGAGHSKGTLVSGILFHCSRVENGFDGSDPQRPGIVHRLDKDTSGVLVAAKNPRTHEYLAGQFKRRETEKLYLAVTATRPESIVSLERYRAGHRVESFIARNPEARTAFTVVDESRGIGKRAVSHVRLLGISPDKAYALFAVRIETGRTHQIRVHLEHEGFPVVGDTVYRKRTDRKIDTHLLLHAFRLRISIRQGDPPRQFEAPIPKDMREFIEKHRIQ